MASKVMEKMGIATKPGPQLYCKQGHIAVRPDGRVEFDIQGVMSAAMAQQVGEFLRANG